MGESTTITHALLTIVAISIAASFALVVVSRTSLLSNTISQLVYSKSQDLKVRVILTYMYKASDTEYVVYAKNVGDSDLTGYEYIDVSFGTYGGELKLYTYNTSGGAGHWSVVEYGAVSGVGEKGETIELHIYTSAAVEPPYHVRLVLPSGLAAEEVFTS